jgi:hypothetical protein
MVSWNWWNWKLNESRLIETRNVFIGKDDLSYTLFFSSVDLRILWRYFSRWEKNVLPIDRIAEKNSRKQIREIKKKRSKKSLHCYFFHKY